MMSHPIIKNGCSFLRTSVRFLVTVTALSWATATISGCDDDDPVSTEPALVVPPPLPATSVDERMDPSDWHRTLRLPGEVEGSQQVTLATPAGGLVERVHVQVGDPVRHGQLLAEVDLAPREVDLERARAADRQASMEHERILAIGDTATDQQRLDLETRAALARADLRTAELARDRARVTAPFGGVVAARLVEPGEVAPPGGALLQLVDAEPAVVRATVASADAALLEAGMQAQITQVGSDTSSTGTLARVHPTADPASRTVTLVFEVANGDGALLPGTIATAVLQVPQDEGR
jgi:membrane fusion protein, multidrug efflux system